MRIAVAYDCLYPWTQGGAQKLYTAIATEFAAVGNDVTYVTRQQWAEGETPSDDFTVVPVSSVEIYDERGVRRVAAGVAFAAALFRHFRRHRADYDAIYASALPSLNVFAIRAALLGRGIPILFDWPEIWSYRQSVGYSGRIVGTIAFVLQRLAIAATPSATVYGPMSVRNWKRNGGRGEPLVLGMIDDDLSAEPRLAKADPPYALYIGRHIPDKQVESIPAAIAAARVHVPELRAVILGDGPTRAAVEAAVEASGAGAYIDLPGFVSADELAEYVADATVLLHPSRREGFGMVVVEAAARATPAVVVVDEENAAADLVTDGVNGYRASSATAADLAAAVVGVVSGGTGLRQSTTEWFSAFLAEGTMRSSAARILAMFDARR